MAADLLATLARANLAAGLAILLVLVLRIPARRHLGAGVAYRMWIIVPLAMAAVLVPPRTVTLTLTQTAAPALEAAAPAGPTSAPADYSPLLLGLWLAGVALSLAVLAERQRRFRALLGRLTRADNGVLRAEGATGPAVFGAFRPRIVVPADFEALFTAPERRAVLAHERQHLSARHPQTNGLLALVQCLCWFNPLLWLGGHALRLDQELACDAGALARSPGLSPRLYGEALLRTQLNAPPLPLGCHWPPGGAGPLKERLLMLKSPKPKRRVQLFGAGMISLAAAAAAVCAWAAQPAEVRVVTLQSKAQVSSAAPGGIVAKQDINGQQARHVPAPPSVTSNSVAGRRGVITPSPVEPPRPAIINDPNWVERPAGADLMKAYPERAMRLEKTGLATLNCTVAESGKLQNCAVVSESPEGLGFGQSALAMSEKFTMKPPSAGGAATVNIPIKFDIN